MSGGNCSSALQTNKVPIYLVVKIVAWLQGQLSMQTAVLSPEMMTTLMRVNMESYNTQLEAMLQDRSSNSPEHWQQVAVCHACCAGSCETGVCLVVRQCAKLERGRKYGSCVVPCMSQDRTRKPLSFVTRPCCCL